MILAIASFLTILASTVCMPIAGVFSDKFNRKILIVVVDSLQAVVTLIGTILFQFDLMTIITVLIFMSVRSIFQAFHMPTVAAITPTMVPLDKLIRINSISFFFVGVIQIFAQLVAAILWLIFPIQIILWVDIVTFLIALIPLIIIKIPSVKSKPKTNIKAEGKSSFFKEFILGIKTLKLIPGLVIIIIMYMLVNLLMMPLKVLMSLYVYGVHGGLAGHYALTLTFFQGGMVLGALITFVKKKWPHKIRVVFSNLAIGMIGYIILALAPKGSYIIISIGAIIMGLTFPITSSLITTFIQTTVPPDKMGRVMSITSTLTISTAPIGTILVGPLAEILGIPYLFFFSAILGLIVAGSIWIFTNIRKVDFDDTDAIKKVNEKINNIST